MPNENYEMSQTMFGEEMQKHMDALNLSIRDVAEKAGSTYEYTRKLVRGLSLPSKYMINTLATVLGWDAAEMHRLMTSDRIRKEHGDIPLELAGKNPEILPIERAWEFLTQQEKDIILAQVQTFVRQHKKHQRQGA